MQISFVLAKKLHMSANCTSKQTNKMNMNYINNKNYINNNFIVLQIQFLQFFVLLDSLGNCVEGFMCPLKGLVHCTMPCSPPPPPLFKTRAQRLNLLQGQAILEPKQNKTQACISLGRTQTFKKLTFHYYRYKNHK